VERKSNYIDWLFNLEHVLVKYNIEFSDYDEFHVSAAIEVTENIIRQYNITRNNHLTEELIDEYLNSAIKQSPEKKDYYETISGYVKKRLLHIE
jgi:hypothetical protein